MADTVMVQIPVSREAASVLADEARREKVGKLVSDMLRPGGPADDPLKALIAELKREARAGGLTDDEIDAELAAYNAERRLWREFADRRAAQMAIDTLGFSISTTAELDSAKSELKSNIGQLKSDLAGTETSLRAEIAKLEATMTMRTIAIVGSLNAVLFALLKFTWWKRAAWGSRKALPILAEMRVDWAALRKALVVARVDPVLRGR